MEEGAEPGGAGRRDNSCMESHVCFSRSFPIAVIFDVKELIKRQLHRSGVCPLANRADCLKLYEPPHSEDIGNVVEGKLPYLRALAIFADKQAARDKGLNRNASGGPGHSKLLCDMGVLYVGPSRVISGEEAPLKAKADSIRNSYCVDSHKRNCITVIRDCIVGN